MFSRILLPLDRSALAECVLPHAVAVARAFESQVTLLHVMDTLHQGQWRRTLDPLNWQIRKAEAQTYLHNQMLRVKQAGLTTETKILEGLAAEQVVAYTSANEVQLIILSSHGQSGLSGWNVSSVVQKIVPRVCASTMIVRAYQPPIPEVIDLHYRRLLVPLDGSQRAECVLPVVATLARTHQSEVMLVHVVRRPEMPRRTLPTREDVELADRLIERNRAEVTQYLDHLRARLTGEIQTRVLVSEHVATTLHELVGQESIDLVVLSAHGCSGQTQWTYGSLVGNFIMHGTTSLLIMQDVSPDQMVPTQAEVAASEHGRP